MRRVATFNTKCAQVRLKDVQDCRFAASERLNEALNQRKISVCNAGDGPKRSPEGLKQSNNGSNACQIATHASINDRNGRKRGAVTAGWSEKLPEPTKDLQKRSQPRDLPHSKR
jgi:hypothetical protein